MKLELYDFVELAVAVSEAKGVPVGTPGRIVMIHPGREAYCVEFEGLIANLPGSALRFIRHIPHDPHAEAFLRKRSSMS